ncbi:MAG: GxxExxY protein [Patescibacteria group bacterium]|nr:GxxExxY protein [Patescibacteria group bacterium]
MTAKSLLYKELSYQIQGAAIAVRKHFGSGHKEELYQRAFEEELKIRNIPYQKEAKIKIYSPLTGKIVGVYQPDFLIDDKIIVELKAKRIIPRDLMERIYDYLRNSKYELGYFINFASPQLFIKRIIYTNNRKHWINFRGSS